MLEGLEATEILRSKLNEELRYEAEYFRKRYLAQDAARMRWPTVTVAAAASVTDGPHGYHIIDPDSDVIMLTAKNAKDWFTTREGADPLARHIHEENMRSSLEEDDVVLSTRGTVGCCALVTREVLPANLDQDVARISDIDREKLLPSFFAAYLNSTYGQDHITREASGMVQQGLSLNKVRSIPIPRLPMSLQKAVDTIVREALRLRRDASAQLAVAEQSLRCALRLDGWRPLEPLSYVRCASEVAMASRFDAPYFSPAKTESARILSEKGARPLAAYFESIREMVSPGGIGSDRVLNFDVGAASQVVLDETSPSVEGFDSAKKRFLPGDVVISRLRHYLRQIAVVRTPSDAVALGSSEFIVLRPKTEALPQEAVVLFLRCLPVQTILEYSQDGSHHPRFSEEDLLAIPFPDAMLPISSGLAASVRTVRAARREAQVLLARALRAVEVAIEQGESAAIKLLK